MSSADPVLDPATIEIRRSKRRTLSVEVQPTGKVIVRSPHRLPMYVVEQFLHERRYWVQTRVAAAMATISSLPPVPALPPRRHTMAVLQEMVEKELPSIGLHSLRYAGTRVRKMRRRWGSCTGMGLVTLNEKLVLVPEHCARAVVVHELCHLVHMNHGAAFRELTRSIMPGIDEADRELDRWSYILLS